MEMSINDRVDSLIDSLHELHRVNASRLYVAHNLRQPRPEKLMPTVSFIHEYFIYNSMYQVDWEASYQQGKVVNFGSEKREMDKQKTFIKYLKHRITMNGIEGNKLLYLAFSPLSVLPPAEGDWTRINPDHNISESKGLNFFKSLLKIQDILYDMENNMQNNHKAVNADKYISNNNMYYIYMIRNNIFHGTKRIGGSVYVDQDQLKRIIYYDIFLKAVTSLFFLTYKKSPVASEMVQLPIYDNTLIHELLNINDVWSLVINKDIKEKDSMLMAKFNKIIKPYEGDPIEKSALFYPSAGADFITPIILGLPFCREFYFYEHEPLGQLNRIRRNNNDYNKRIDNKLKKIISKLNKIVGFDLRMSDWTSINDEEFICFEYDGIERTIHWVHKDNKDFLNIDANLTFYFHRGDSHGEGGSRQYWDSDLLPELMKKVPNENRCLFVTDGVPGELLEPLKKTAQVLKISEGYGGNYYFGIMPYQI